MREFVKNRSSFWKRAAKLLFYLSIFLFLWLLYSAISIHTYGIRSIGIQTNADVAVVLGAAAWNDNPSPVFKSRLDWVIQLYHRKHVPKILITGGRSEGKKFSEAEVGKSYAISKGVLPEDIWMEEKSHTTFQNLYYALPVAQSHGAQKWVIVSDPLHMRRAMLMSRTLHIQAQASATPYTRYTTWNKKWSMTLRETLFDTLYRVASLFISPTKHPEHF